MIPSPKPAKRSFVLTLGFLTGLAALTVDLSLPAVPALADALSTSVSRGQQIVGVFMAGMACGQIPAGLISDRVGRLPVLFGGMALFEAGAIAAAFADQIDLMLVARFVQGFGAAAALVLSRAIVRDIASGKEAARMMSLMTMIFTIAPVIAPTIGALMILQWGWRGPFWAIAVFGLLIIFCVRAFIHETHTPGANEHPVQQLKSSFREFFSHRQSILGLLFIILPPIGFMSIITVSSALIIEHYGVSVTTFGIIFAGAGLSLLCGSALNRKLVERLDLLQLIGLGISAIGVAGLQFLVMMILDAAPLWWLWGNVCLFFVGIGVLLPNATVLALDPLPKIAGVASSIIGTSQNITGALGALGGAFVFTGGVRNSMMLMTFASLAMVSVFLLRRLICGGPIVHHAQALARD